MVAMTVTLKVSPEKREEFLQTMRSLESDLENEKGLRKSSLCQEIDNGGFRLIYEWETREDLDRYLGTEKSKVLYGALRTLCTKADIRYTPVGGSGDEEEWKDDQGIVP